MPVWGRGAIARRRVGVAGCRAPVMGDPQRVLVVVDDAADVRALARTILCLDGRFTIAGEAADGAAAIERARAAA